MTANLSIVIKMFACILGGCNPIKYLGFGMTGILDDQFILITKTLIDNPVSFFLLFIEIPDKPCPIRIPNLPTKLTILILNPLRSTINPYTY